ncbi:hypothetical protein HK414_01990 [Ramlibacter terrae]|uniref:Hybrid sensor histidine kinase/response regulator n=1 Tax=Ramlibacter terrae TaxID=2732511 RepID=A0ABX6P1Y3_9BURK|nr:hypothetical protein HK414_01990 [Ramlibacter terrae]
MKIAAGHSIQRKLNLILLATVGPGLLLAAATVLLLEVRQELLRARQDLMTQADVVGPASEAALSFSDRNVGEQTLRVLQRSRA